MEIRNSFKDKEDYFILSLHDQDEELLILETIFLGKALPKLLEFWVKVEFQEDFSSSEESFSGNQTLKHLKMEDFAVLIPEKISLVSNSF